MVSPPELPSSVEEGRAEVMGAAEGRDESKASAGVVLFNKVIPLTSTPRRFPPPLSRK